MNKIHSGEMATMKEGGRENKAKIIADHFISLSF
jgi:hypothetical protein